MIHSKIFKAYDIRGIYPDEINEELAYRIGQAYCQVVSPDGPVAVGMDVRTHSERLKRELIKGIIATGNDVVDLGLISTEMLYFAVGNYGYAGGIQVTASHNTAEYNGFKMVRSKAVPISSDSGILQIRDLILSDEDKTRSSFFGKTFEKQILSDFARFVLRFVDQTKIGKFKIAYNPNFGFGGEVLKEVKEVGEFNFELIGLNSTLDGTFPKGQPDPFKKENRSEFVQFVKETEADIGVAWDADADRVFFCTKEGEFVEPYYMNAILIKYLLNKSGGGKIIYDPRYTWALIDTAKDFGGEALIERVGHSFIKERMRKEDALFGGESSGHAYFKDFWYADSGIIPLLIVLEMLSSGPTLTELLTPLKEKYFISGEINKTIDDKDTIFDELRANYSDADLQELDGLSIEYQDWRANIRASNTEPLLRINIEAKSKERMEEKRDEILSLIG